MKTLNLYLVSSVSGLIVFGFQLGLSMVSGSLNVSSQIKILESEIKLVRQDIKSQRELQDYKIKQLKANIESIEQDTNNE